MSTFITVGPNIAFQMRPLAVKVLGFLRLLQQSCGCLSDVVSKSSSALQVGKMKKPIKVKFPSAGKMPSLSNKKAQKIVQKLTEEMKDFIMDLIMQGVPAYMTGYTEAAIEWRRESMVGALGRRKGKKGKMSKGLALEYDGREGAAPAA